MVRAYKFLDRSGRTLYTGTEWRPGTWVEAQTVRECHEGVHACLPADLAWWLAADLWEVELDGEVVRTRHKVAAQRGRLVRRIDDYPAAVTELGARGAWQARDRAVPVLRAAGHESLADRFAGCTTIAELAALRRTAFEAVDQDSFAGPAATFAADVAFFVDHGEPAEAPFVACCAAGHAAAGPEGTRADYDGGYAAMRDEQSAWLTTRLGLLSS